MTRAILALTLSGAVLSCSHTPPAAALKEPAAVTPSVTGVVRGADGRPAAGAVVALNPSDPATSAAQEGAAFGVITTGVDGRFTFFKAPAGRYALAVTSDRWRAALVPDLQLVEQRALEVPVDLAEGGALVTVHPELDDHTPVVADVILSGASGQYGDVFHTVARDGAFIARLPPGQYWASAKAGRLTGSNNLFVIGDEPHPAEVRQTLTLSLPLVDQPPAPREVVDWLAAHARPLASTEPGSRLDDLDGLVAMVGDARVVGVGEATHGSREFFQLRHRVLEALVARRGFTLLALEAPWADTLALNDYVLGGPGDAAQLVGRLRFWTWDTEEVVDVLKWLRAWNQDSRHARKVELAGVDKQSPQVAARLVRDFLATVDPGLASRQAAELGALASECRVVVPSPRGPTSAQLKQVASELHAAFAANRERWVAKRGVGAFRRAEHAAEVLSQATDETLSRDEAMATNVRWLLDATPETKVVVWAHNGHLGARPGSMGEALKLALGPQLVTFTIAFNQGAFRAIEMPFDTSRGVLTHVVPPAWPGSLDGTLARVGLPAYAVDLRELPKQGAVAAWFAAKHGTRHIGSGFDPAHEEWFLDPVVAASQSDAVLFVDRTSAARANGPSSQERALLKAPENLDLSRSDMAPWELRGASAGFGATLRPAGCGKAGRCLALSGAKKSPALACGMVVQGLDAAAYAGRVLRLRGDARGTATAMVFAVTNKAAAEVDVSGSRWAPFSLELEVPQGATYVLIGAALDTPGEGEALLGPMQLEVVAPAPH